MLDAHAPVSERAVSQPPPAPEPRPSPPTAAADISPAARLLAISALCLFLEMALIRFINSTVQVIAYFNNFVILASFLGLGFGALWAKRSPRLFAHSPWLLALIVGMLVLFDRFLAATHDQADFVAWMQHPESVPLALPAGVVVVAVFVATFAVFVPLGCELGQRIDAFGDRLRAYGYDLLGSIAGVLVFALVSWGRYAPWVWFALASGLLGGLLWADGIRLRWRGLALLAAVALSASTASGYYSPYYKIEIASYFESSTNKLTHYSIFVDKNRIQDAIDFSRDLSRSSLGAWIPYYRLPYQLAPEPGRVLVLGGGSGNDTAIALASGAKRVTTVEIDPLLVDFGHELHPQRPYADARVRAVNDDARAFLRRGTEDYDLIVMNALDSHHQLPGLSTLRLESYIYTVQSFEDVRRHMHPGSVLVVHLGSTRPWMGERLYWTLTQAFGHEPTLVTTAGSPFESIAFVYAPTAVLDKARTTSSGLLWGKPDHMRSVREATTLATDDWPHLYLASPRIPDLYYQVLAFILVLSIVCFRAVGAARTRSDLLHFSLLGAAFMLLETRAITQFALLFGSTWLVNAIVVSSILVMIYLGNRLLQTEIVLPKTVVYCGLLASLVALYFVPLDALLPYNLGLRVLGAALVVGVPLFGASLVFSDSFRRAPDAAAAFGANLVGVVVGGALEYSSMQFGLKMLYPLAALIYLLAFLAERAWRRDAGTGAAPEAY
jgi:Spermine/spermidine synthase domain